MPTADFIVSEAINEMFCEPAQDGSTLFRLKRLSVNKGVKKRLRVIWKYIDMPDNDNYWHVFSIGQYHPALLSLKNINDSLPFNEWINFHDTIKQGKTVIDMYTVNGMIVPRFICYYMFTQDKNLILAFKDNNLKTFSCNNDQFFLRIYDNSWLESVEATQQDYTLSCYGKYIQNTTDIIDITNAYKEAIKSKGHTLPYKNGYLIDKIDPSTIAIEDYVEFIQDGSIKIIKTFDESVLLSFDSVLDDIKKYLIHYPLEEDNMINYQDDVDVYIRTIDSLGKSVGLFYNKNNPNAIRMVTHRDYSLSVSYIRAYMQILTDLFPVNKTNRPFWVDIYIRKSGLTRPLVFESNYLHYLYKLEDNDIQRALLGIDSNVPFWNAAELENSSFCKIMRSHSNKITHDLAIDAFGYNAGSILLGDTPKKPYDHQGNKVIDLPVDLRTLSTAYEYDTDGKLIDSYPISIMDKYVVKNSNCSLVEVLGGSSNIQTGDIYANDTLPIDTSREYRVYLGYMVGDELIENPWKDITDSNLYTIENNVISWGGSATDGHVIMVRYLDSFLDYSFTVNHSDGLLLFPIKNQIKINQQLKLETLMVPFGELDVFLNGYSLIENIDYFINYPYISICNKKFLNEGDETGQVIRIRFRGFCTKDLQRYIAKDIGFVIDGVLSDNNIFDIRDDKVLRLVSGGKVISKSDLKFSEDTPAIYVNDPSNGLPYSIRDILVNTKKVLNVQTYPYKEIAEAKDKIVSDYMTLKHVKPFKENINVIQELYQLVSPFISKIIYSLINGSIPEDNINGQKLDNMTVIEICKPYEYLLVMDPIKTIMTNSKYIDIHPIFTTTTKSLSFYQYRFLTQVVDLYAKDQINLSPFIQLK